MKKTHIGETKSQRFFSGKGFYAALALSLVAVGGAAWLGVNSAMDKLESPPPDLSNNTQVEEQTEWSLPETPAEVKKDEVKADTSSTVPKQEEQANTSVVQGYILPLKGGVLNAYSGDNMVKSKTLNDWVMHTGMDISAAVSTPVKAMSGGKVESIENDTMWGTTVTIKHTNGMISQYSNLKSAVNVKVNQTVSMGTVLGAVGETSDIERAEESHLHFAVKKDGSWVDPMSVIK